MIDLHTHLLPDWDDGAKDWEESAAMARAAVTDGITKIGLTPHLYRLTKHGDDMIVDNIKRNNLTVNNSCYVFVEFPADSVIAGVKELFYQIMLKGYIPIISHPERNMVFGKRPELLFDLVSMGALAQVTAKSILGQFGHQARQAAGVFLKHNLVHLIASDAHDSESRPPLLSKAVERAKKIVGEERALAMVTKIPQAILDNQEIPEYGDPENPAKKSK
jgi:protein-tyrosine phosphatase